MAAQYIDYTPKAGDTLKSAAKNIYGDENMYGFLQNNGINTLTPGQAIKAPMLAGQNAPGMTPNPRDAMATSKTPTQVTQTQTPTPQTQQVGVPNAPAPELSFGGQLANTPAPNPNISTQVNAPAFNGTNGQRPEMVGGNQSFQILEMLKTGQIDAGETPVTPAEQEAFAMYKSYQKYGNADAKTLFQAIQTGELTPDPNNVLWRAIAKDGKATPAMAQAFAWWDDAQKRGATSLRGDKDPFLAGQFPDKFASAEDANNWLNSDAIEGEVWDSPSDGGTLSRMETILNEAMGVKAPTAPNYTQMLTDLRTKYSVGNLEQELGTLDAQLADMEAQSRQRQQFQMDQPVAMGVIAGRMSEVQRQDQEKMDYVARRRDSIANQINTANNTINLMMKTAEMDYNTAAKDYAMKMESAVGMMEQFQQYRESELDQFNKDRDYLQEERKTESANARANLQTYYNALMDGGMDPSKLTKADIMNISKLEMQAGMAVGTFTTLRNKNPTMDVKSTTERYDVNGDKYFDVVMFDKVTGKIKVEEIFAGRDASKQLDIMKKQSDLLMDPLERQYKQSQIDKAGMEMQADYDVTGGPSPNANTSDYLKNYGAITGPNGSPLWKYGLDVDLKKGDPVYSPVTGEVVKVGENGGFGKQVQIKDAKGNLVWLSHLDGASVSVGQKVNAGAQVGIGGNTGNTIKGPKGDGSHLDITIKKPDGSYFSAPEVQAYVSGNYASEVRAGTNVTKKSTSETAKKDEVRTFINQKINEDNLLGSDGKMSPDDYNFMKNQWVSMGFSPAEFDTTYGQYINLNIGAKYDTGTVADKIKRTETNKKAVEDAKKEAIDRVKSALPSYLQ